MMRNGRVGLSRDHPRLCGEHVASLNVGAVGQGSSPLVRGTRLPSSVCLVGSSPLVRETLAVDVQIRTRWRIIPACAGNTRSGIFDQSAKSDHPRLCGEHVMDEIDSGARDGSSPLVRGTPPARALSPYKPRIIPACAGNTGCRPSPRYANRDHPRLCGEHTAISEFGTREHGSSPLVRGTHTAIVARRRPGRIIPACAGNTGVDDG